ncbi:iron uptake porin [Nostoc linckia]|uniref:iron uptake porin n=1 Tax=Nostoc linckia TaxID=92942 RepID=UPI001F54CAE4|nr:iron uptake porin [Nostoc linckia]
MHLISSLSILGLIAQSTFALAGVSESTAVSREWLITPEAVSAANFDLWGTTDKTTTATTIPPTTTFIAQLAPDATLQGETLSTPASMDSVTSVSQFADVQLTDWAFQALQSLIQRYGCITGYADGTYRGNQALTRYEFAANLNACLERVNQQIATATADSVTQEELVTLQRLQTEFSPELATLRGRVDSLEARTAEVAASQFSTTTKLIGQAIFAVNMGGFSGDRIIAPTGAVIADENPNATFIYRASLNLNTSFNGTDLLQIRLLSGSDGSNDNAAGFLEPNFGSVLDFSVPGRNDQLGIGRLFYTFTPVKDLSVTLGAAIVATDFVDKNAYANTSFLDFSTQALINNFILFPRPAGSGAVINWNPGGGAFKLRAVYVAANGASLNSDSQRFIGGPSAPILIFPNRGGDGGLFADPYQGIIELEYSEGKAFAVRLQYAGGEVLDSRFNAFGVNFELALSQTIGVFGRYGYGDYSNTFQGDINPNYWMAGIAFRDLFVPGGLAGIAAGQPFIENTVGNATQTNIEAFYNLPISDNIRVTPLVQVIIDPGNQNINGTIITGTVRTVFSF